MGASFPALSLGYTETVMEGIWAEPGNAVSTASSDHDPRRSVVISVCL